MQGAVSVLHGFWSCVEITFIPFGGFVNMNINVVTSKLVLSETGLIMATIRNNRDCLELCGHHISPPSPRCPLLKFIRFLSSPTCTVEFEIILSSYFPYSLEFTRWQDASEQTVVRCSCGQQAYISTECC